MRTSAIFVVVSLAQFGLALPMPTAAMAPITQPQNLASWKKIANRKVQNDLEKIPLEWRLPEAVIDDAKKQRSIADAFIEGLLKEHSRFITRLDVPALMKKTGNGSLSAVEVVKAYCQRAAYGHQLV
jgi:amidase